MSATKLDEGKPTLSFIFDCPVALDMISRVIEHGANKYGRANWNSNTNKEDIEAFKQRLIEASIRHMGALARGEYLDPESMLPHPAHIAVNQMFIMELTLKLGVCNDCDKDF